MIKLRTIIDLILADLILADLILADLVLVLARIWVGRVVGAGNRACQDYPYTSGCR